MKFFRIAILISLSFCFYQCGPSEWDVTLYAQKIEGTSKILYKYDAWGGRDSHVAGYVILDSTETFEVNVNKLLPISQIDGIPTKNYISAIEVNEPNGDTASVYIPVIKATMEQEGINIKIKNYDYNGFVKRGQGLRQYAFESFKETRDSLYFYNLDDIYFEEPFFPHLDVLKLKKGNIVIRQDKNKDIISIDTDDLILSGNDELLSNITYLLAPKKTLKSETFSDYGIFKQVFIGQTPQ